MPLHVTVVVKSMKYWLHILSYKFISTHTATFSKCKKCLRIFLHKDSRHFLKVFLEEIGQLYILNMIEK